jgi:hypothetical protein
MAADFDVSQLGTLGAFYRDHGFNVFLADARGYRAAAMATVGGKACPRRHQENSGLARVGERADARGEPPSAAEEPTVRTIAAVATRSAPHRGQAA